MDGQRVPNMAKREQVPRKPTSRSGKGGNDKTERDAVGQAIGNQLRALYDEVAREPVPDRFRILLDRLAAQEPGEESGQKGS